MQPPTTPPTLPPSAPPSFMTAPLDYLISLTADEAGEAALVHTIAHLTAESPAWHHQVRHVWISAVIKGLALNEAERAHPENKPYLILAQRPLVDAMRGLSRAIIVPRADNFTPAKRTPWGGNLIPQMKKELGIGTGDVVGESWEISGHPSFPNRIPLAYAGHALAIPLWMIGSFSPIQLYGMANVKRFGNAPPFLTKLLNSGSWKEYKEALRPLLAELDKAPPAHEWRAQFDVASLTNLLDKNNHELHEALMVLRDASADIAATHRAMIARNLSIQIHPDARYATKNSAWHSKTEMWVVLDREDGAGFYIGLKAGVTEAMMREALEANRDVSGFLNFIEVKAGDVFFIPAGTPHAIGAGVLLLEQQETSETTFRYFSWWDGRELHVNDAVDSTHWNSDRGMAFVDGTLRRQPRAINAGAQDAARHELLAAEDEFTYDRVTFSGNDTYAGEAHDGMHGITVTEGCLSVAASGTTYGPFSKGQSFIIPATIGRYELRAPSGIRAVAYIGRSDPRVITT